MGFVGLAVSLGVQKKARPGQAKFGNMELRAEETLERGGRVGSRGGTSIWVV